MCPEASLLKPGGRDLLAAVSSSQTLTVEARRPIFYYHALRKMRPRDITQFPKLMPAVGRQQSWHSNPGPSASSACLLSGTHRGSPRPSSPLCKLQVLDLSSGLNPVLQSPLILSEAKPGLQVTPTPLDSVPAVSPLPVWHVSALQLRVPLGEKCPVATYSLKITRPLRFL